MYISYAWTRSIYLDQLQLASRLLPYAGSAIRSCSSPAPQLHCQAWRSWRWAPRQRASITWNGTSWYHDWIRCVTLEPIWQSQISCKKHIQLTRLPFSHRVKCAMLWKQEEDKAGQVYHFSGATVDPTRSSILPLEELGDLVTMKAMCLYID